MSNLMKVQVSGNAVVDAEMKETASSMMVKLRIAVNQWDRREKAEKTEYVNITMFCKEGRAQQLVDRVKKGAYVVASGTGEIERYEGKNGFGASLSITADEIDVPLKNVTTPGSTTSGQNKPPF